MIVARGKFENSGLDLHLSGAPMFWPELRHPIIPVYANSREVMKPLLFDTDKVLSDYIATADVIAKLSKHLAAERVVFLNPALLYAGDIFQTKGQKDIFIHMVSMLNPGVDISEIIPYIPDDIVGRLSTRDNDRKSEFCVILLNQPYDDIDIDNLKNLSNPVTMSHWTDGTLSEDFYAKPRSSFVISDLMDDFYTNVYTLKNSNWINEKTFESKVNMEHSVTSIEWLRANYEFIRKLLQTYFDPTAYTVYSKTKGFIFTSFVHLLYNISPKVDLAYWDFNADLWVNLNLIGFNPSKEISNFNKSIKSETGTVLLSKLNSSQIVDLFVHATNYNTYVFGGTVTATQKRVANNILNYEDPENVIQCIRHTEKHETVLEKLRTNFTKIKRLDALERFERGLELYSDKCFNHLNITDEYSVNLKDISLENRTVAFAYGLLAAFTAPHSLNFHEAKHRFDYTIDKPGYLEFITYLYKHRGWMNKDHLVNIERGRFLEVHAHTAVKAMYIACEDDLSRIQYHSNPTVTFKLGLDLAAEKQYESMKGADFKHLPDHLAKVMDDRFFHIATPYDLVAEGKIMNHCCGGSGYISECADDERIFFHFQPPETTHYAEGVTFDLDIDDYSKTKFSMSSMQLHSNKTPCGNWKDEIHKFVDALNKAQKEYVALTAKETDDQLAKAC